MIKLVRNLLLLLNRSTFNGTLLFIPTSRIGKPGWYNKFRGQNCLLNQSPSKILLIGDSIISNLGRYPEIWKKYPSDYNTLILVYLGIKFNMYYGKYKISIFLVILALSIFLFFAEQTILTIIPQKILSTE